MWRSTRYCELFWKERFLSTAVGDEGGFAPDLADSQEVLALIVRLWKKQDINREKIF